MGPQAGKASRAPSDSYSLSIHSAFKEKRSWAKRPAGSYPSLSPIITAIWLSTCTSHFAKREPPQRTQSQPPWRAVSSPISFWEALPHKHLVEILLTLIYCILLGGSAGIIACSIFLYLQHWLVTIWCLASGFPPAFSALSWAPKLVLPTPRLSTDFWGPHPGVGNPRFSRKGVQTVLVSQCSRSCNASYEQCDHAVWQYF